MKSLWLAVCVALMLANSGYARADKVSNHKKIELAAFMPAELALKQFDEMRVALANGSCLEVAKWIKYGFVIHTADRRGPTLVFADSAFCEDFPVIFDQKRIKAFLDQTLEETARVDGGFFFWKSGLWVQAACPKFLDLSCSASELQLRITSVIL